MRVEQRMNGLMLLAFFCLHAMDSKGEEKIDKMDYTADRLPAPGSNYEESGDNPSVSDHFVLTTEAPISEVKEVEKMVISQDKDSAENDDYALHGDGLGDVVQSSIKDPPVSKEVPIKIDEIEKGVVSDSNATVPHKWPCVATNLTQVDGVPLVLPLSNDEKVMAMLHKLNQSSGCALVLFYSPYCGFSMKLSPLYNALGRTYRDLAVMAIDAQESMGMAARYGIVGIPTVLLFFSGKAVAKFNRSRSAEDFQSFIKDYTGFEPSGILEVLPEDYAGPLPTQVIERTTLHLTIAMGFLMCFLTYHLFGGLIWLMIRKMGSDLKALLVHEKVE